MVFNDVDSQGKPAVQIIGNFANWTVIYFQVIGPNTLRISAKQANLAQPRDGQVQGLQIVGPDIQKIEWIGPLYGVGSGPNTVVNVEVPGADA
jgi:hypothetical protein